MVVTAIRGNLAKAETADVGETAAVMTADLTADEMDLTMETAEIGVILAHQFVPIIVC